MTVVDTHHLSVLVVDDDKVDRAAVRRAMRWSDLSVSISEAGDAPEALEELRRGHHDCVLLDFRLPKADGLAVLHVARAEGIRTPIIILTGQGDEQLAVEIMKAGAADYISKSALTPERLRQSVLQAVRVRRADIATETERQRLARLHGFLAALAVTRTVLEVAHAVMTQGIGAFAASRGVLALADAGPAALEVLRIQGYSEASWNPASEPLPRALMLPLSAALRSEEPQLFATRAELHARYPELVELQPLPDVAFVAVPLLVGKRPLAVLGLGFDAERDFGNDVRNELIDFARVCGQALDRAQLFDLAQRERRRAEEASRAKDEFLAVVSHELRTPLNAVLGWAKMLNDDVLSAEQAKRATAAIHRNALSQAQLIEDLLDVSRITTGKLRIDTALVDVAAVLDAATEVVRHAADAKNVQIESELRRDLSPLLADRERLQQVFWNLLSNSVKFTPRGGRVRVSLEMMDAAYVVRVQDTGQGIAAEFLPHVFERFQQEGTGTTRAAGGLGLGLAIVRHIVELHGGNVQAESAGLGQGTTFTVRLPISSGLTRDPSWRPLAPQQSSGESPSALPQASAPPQLNGLHVLVVDDHPDARDLLVSVFSRCGARVTSAASAAEAFGCFGSQRPDVLVSDIGMPGEDGYALIQRIRALPLGEGGDIPAIALTAYATADDRGRALLAGYTVHASKPIDTQELLEAVVRLVGSK